MVIQNYFNLIKKLNNMDILEKIRKSNYWFIAVVIISVYFLTISLKFPTDVIDNNKLLNASTIGLLYGVTSWMMHNIYFMRWYKRNPYLDEIKEIENKYFFTQGCVLIIFLALFVTYVL